MAATSTESTAARRLLLGAAMGAVLLAAVGIAWLLQAAAAKRVRAGGEILRHIRSQGLSRYWKDNARTDWYLVRSGSTVLGWRASVRERIDQQGYRGLVVDVRAAPGGKGLHQVSASWILNADASEGQYHGRVRQDNQLLLYTRIVLKDSTVSVVQVGAGGQPAQATSPAPAHYFPEGTLGPVLREVARQGADAQFAIVFDDKPNPRSVVEFNAVRIRPAGQGQTPDGRPTQRVQLSYRGWGRGQVTYELSEDGDILAIRYKDGTECLPASETEVTSRFPEAAKLLPAQTQPPAPTEGGKLPAEATSRPLPDSARAAPPPAGSIPHR